MDQILSKLRIPKSEVLELLYDKTVDLKDGFYVFTGKGLRSGEIHLGHFFLFSLISKLSHNHKVFFQISNDQKRDLRDRFLTLKQVNSYTDSFRSVVSTFDWKYENLVMFDNLGSDKMLLDNAAQYLSRYVRSRTITSVFGDVAPYFYYYVLIQCAPLLILKDLPETPVIITAEDQKGIFMILRDVCVRLGIKKPIVVVIKPLKNIMMRSKMSSSEPKMSIGFDRRALTNLKRAISSRQRSQDFCMHFVDKISFLVPCQLKERWELLWRSSRSLDLKVQISKFLDRFLNRAPVQVNEGLREYICKRHGRQISMEKLEQIWLPPS